MRICNPLTNLVSYDKQTLDTYINLLIYIIRNNCMSNKWLFSVFGFTKIELNQYILIVIQ